jgi:uncharacterized protein involved in cysteine biosynthesis
LKGKQDKFIEKLPVKAAAGKLEAAAGRVRSAAGRVRRVILQPVSRGGFVREFFLGFKYFFRGWKTVFTFRSDLWVWAVLPVFLSLFLYVLTFAIIGFKLDDIIQIFLPPVQESAFWKAMMVLIWILVMAGVVIVGYFLFVPVMTLVSAPMSEVLSEKVEVLLLECEPPPFKIKVFLRELGRTAVQEIVKLLVYLAVMAPLFVISLFIPVIGPIILFLIGGFVTSLYLAYDQMDRCFSRHTMPVPQRINFVKKFFFRSLGLGTVGFFIMLIPGGVIFVLPSTVAGACLLFLESDEDRLKKMREACRPSLDDVPYEP